VLAVFGTAHMTGDRLAFAAITTLYLVIAIPWEERSLVRSFGEDYLRYTRQVRWRIVPFIY
jgi:protein-S-isoprenylcysteine O-methyltransferase Ste14